MPPPPTASTATTTTRATTTAVAATISRRLADEELGRRLARGEAPAFDELYRRYAHRLAAYGTYLLGDGAAGDDVAQVTLMRAYQELRAGRMPERVSPWLHRIAHNAAVDVVRKRREHPTDDVPDGPVEGRDTTTGALLAAVAGLPDRQRRVFVLREIHGLRIGETAAELRLTTQQVEQSLFAARNRLAEQLVFGERLGCAAVRRLAGGPLDMRERRALKIHVRSCPACRRELGVRGVALSLLPLPSLQWLWNIPSAPTAAKVGAVVASVTVTAGIPFSGALHGSHPQLLAQLAEVPGPDVPLASAATQPGPVARRPAARPNRRAVTHAAPRPTPVTAAVRVAITPVPAQRKQRSVPVAGTSRRRAEHRAPPLDASDDGPAPVAAAAIVTATAVPTTTTVESSGGSGDSTSGDGGSGDTITTTTTTSSDGG
jgi:RNA polymerase sigma factor (sigma-70 family)